MKTKEIKLDPSIFEFDTFKVEKSIKGGRVQTLEKTVEAKSRKLQAPSALKKTQ